MIVLVSLGLAVPSQADFGPGAEMSLSNYKPAVGEPIAIVVNVFGCSTLPTSYSLSLYHGEELEPFTTLTKSSPGSVSRIGEDGFDLKWIYRGPAGNGVDNQPVSVQFSGQGGCVTNPDNFGAFAQWKPTGNSAPLAITGFTSFPDFEGLRLAWSTVDQTVDLTQFFEIQYAVSGTNNWSHSITTRETFYNLRGLSTGVVYDLRVRAVNRYGASAWVAQEANSSSRTPALYKTETLTGSSSPSTSFASSEPVNLRFTLVGCASQPSTMNQYGGTISFSVAPVVGGLPNSASGINGTAEARDGATISFNPALGRYVVTVPLGVLADGDYRVTSYFIGDGCTWTTTPEQVGYPVGNLLTFSVGSDSVTLPEWGSNAGGANFPVISALSPTSATFTWLPPLNLEDGPFTYSIGLIESFGGQPRIVGTTTGHSYTLTGLMPTKTYRYWISVGNLATTSVSTQPWVVDNVTMPSLVAKRGTKVTAVQFSKSVNIKVPKGASITVSKPSGKFNFSNCSIAKNTVNYANSVGACTVQISIKPKKVGRVQPASTIEIFDVLIRK